MKELKHFDFEQEKENMLNLIKEKEKEKENESKIFSQIADYLVQQKHKIGAEKDQWINRKNERDHVNNEANKKLEGNLYSKTEKIKTLVTQLSNYKKRLEEIKKTDDVFADEDEE